MRTYDPADCIHYVHMAAGAAVPPAPPQEECHELPADYAALTAASGTPVVQVR